jgi:hypothetical protein
MAERSIDTPPAIARKIAFIDLEASGLGSKSWPVEVAWTFTEGPPAAFLIRPDDAWPDEAWEEGAEALHGISRDDLRRNGLGVREVCAALNEALAGTEVYSDAPDWDGFWLIRLFAAGGVRQEFSIHDYGKLVGPIIAGHGEEILERAARLAPRRHRAAADVTHLQTLYRLARENCGPRLTR